MENQKIRIDIYIAKKLNIPRIKAQELIKNECVVFNNKIITKNNILVDVDDKNIIVKDYDFDNKKNTTDNSKIEPFKDELDIIYQDDDLFIINKKSGIMVHPTTFNETNTLANVIKYYVDTKKIKSQITNDTRMGICHRLDKDTSGLIVVAKNKNCFEEMTKLFKENKVEKTYTALLFGNLESKTLDIDAPIKRIDGTNKREVSTDIDAKECISRFILLKQYDKFCLAEIQIKTGRTHQIRVHAKYINHNIINDPLYGKTKKATKYGQYLVANKIKFVNPISNQLISLSIDLPKEFDQYIKKNGN